jgi:hypothetical protein
MRADCSLVRSMITPPPDLELEVDLALAVALPYPCPNNRPVCRVSFWAGDADQGDLLAQSGENLMFGCGRWGRLHGPESTAGVVEGEASGLCG